MILTPQELDRMRSVDIGAVSADELPDVDGMMPDGRLSRDERAARLLSMGVRACFKNGSVPAVEGFFGGMKTIFCSNTLCIARKTGEMTPEKTWRRVRYPFLKQALIPIASPWAASASRSSLRTAGRPSKSG